MRFENGSAKGWKKKSSYQGFYLEKSFWSCALIYKIGSRSSWFTKLDQGQCQPFPHGHHAKVKCKLWQADRQRDRMITIKHPYTSSRALIKSFNWKLKHSQWWTLPGHYTKDFFHQFGTETFEWDLQRKFILLKTS